jgi:predicted component of type VI protein secretion system
MDCPTCHQAVTATATATNAAGDTATATAEAPPSQAPYHEHDSVHAGPAPLDSNLRRRLEAIKAIQLAERKAAKIVSDKRVDDALKVAGITTPAWLSHLQVDHLHDAIEEMTIALAHAKEVLLACTTSQYGK